LIVDDESRISMSILSQPAEISLRVEDRVALANIKEGLRANEASITEVALTAKNVEVAMSSMVGTVGELTQNVMKNLTVTENNKDILVRMEQMVTTQFEIWNRMFSGRLEHLLKQPVSPNVNQPP
jgi:hypothetical protein